MKMEYDITKMVEEIAMQAKENQEEFIFETIRPYCENVLQIKINKEELKQILLKGIQKQQPCEDCISRESVIEWLKDKDIIKTKNQEENARRELDELPSVTPSRPRGKWIGEESLDGSIRYMCDNCKEFEYVDYYDFCPNCGAKMEVQDANNS